MNRIFLFLLIALLTLGACDKLPENGPLDGQWQLMEIATRQSPDDADFSLREPQKDNRIYWCFQLKLLSIRTLTGSLNGHTDETVGRFRYTGDRPSRNSISTTAPGTASSRTRQRRRLNASASRAAPTRSRLNASTASRWCSARPTAASRSASSETALRIPSPTLRASPRTL